MTMQTVENVKEEGSAIIVATKNDTLPKNNEQPTTAIMVQRNNDADKEKVTNRPEEIFSLRKPIHYNPFTYMFVAWLDPLLWKGFKSPLQSEDLFSMAEADQTGNLMHLLQPFWIGVSQFLKDRDSRKPSLMQTLFNMVSFRWVVAGLCYGLGTGAQLAVPMFIQQFIYYLQKANDKLIIQNGVGIACTIFALQLAGTLLCRSYDQIIRTITINTRSTLMGAIYEKAMKLGNEAAQEFPQGKILNLVNVDAEAISAFMNYSHDLWVTPAQIIAAIILLQSLLGYSTFAALAVLILSLAFQSFLFGPISKFQRKLLGASDARLTNLRETLQTIKTIKLRAWEPRYYTRLANLRAEQVQALKNFNITITLFVIMTQVTPVVMPVVAFLVYAATKGVNLDPAIVFPALSLFQVLVGPLFALPSIGSSFFRARVSFQRLETFLLAPECQPIKKLDESTSSGLHAIDIAGATFRWEAVKKVKNSAGASNATAAAADSSSKKDVAGPEKGQGEPPKESQSKTEQAKQEIEPLFKDLNLAIPARKLTCIVGTVGSGKSSLLSAIIGEMTLTNPDTARIKINGTIAYCPQQAWILTDTVEGNVVFGGGREVDSNKVQEALRVTMMEPDLDTLQNGIHTLIGEKGINLSGGQQARVALARAVYEDADIYLLDDPLSALDAHVGAALFDKCIKQALSNKTRVLVTHQLHVLPYADHIVVLENGRPTEQGEYSTLMAQEDGKLAEMMRHYKVEKQLVADTEPETEGEELAAAATKGVSDTKNSEQYKKSDGKAIVVAEERMSGSVEKHVWFGYYRASGGLLVLLMIIFGALIQQGSQILISQWLAWWSSSQFSLTKSQYMGVFGGLGLVQTIALFLLNGLILYGGYNASVYYHNAALKRLLKAPMSFFESQPIGRILNRFSKDVESIDQMLWVYYFFVIFAVARLLGSIILVSVYFPVILALVIPLSGLYYAILLFYRSSVRELKRLDANQRSPLNAHISESLSGIPSIRAYKAESRFIARQRLLTDLSNAPRYLYLSTAVWLTLRIEVLSAFILLTIGLLGVTKAVSAASAGLTLSYALGVVESVAVLLKSLANLESEMNAVERLEYYTSSLPMEAPARLDTDPDTSSWPSSGAIAATNLEVCYPSRPDHPILKRLTFTIRPGEKVGVVGRTGSGKSTLLSVLFRLIELKSGQLEIDNIDISKIGLETLRSRIQIITQDPVLFQGSIRSNLDAGGTFDDSTIWEVLDKIALKDYVTGLPEKLDAPVAENGKNLSVGQRQLLCLGRAILHKTRILCLDEATASVDQTADALIQNLIQIEFKTATVISVAHRLNTIAGFDRIMVLEAGEIAEFGDPLTLLNKSDDEEHAVFKKLAEATGPANFDLLREIAGKKSIAK